jgi:hypothetical protein
VGSGLILLLIVGAWLAVLVPMALRSSEAARASSTADRFHDAMRVLSRRSSGPRRHPWDVEGEDAPAAPAPAAPAPTAPAASGRRPAAPPRRRLTAAARRRRAVGVLVLLAVGTLVGGLGGPVWLLGVHALADVLLLAVFLWLRSQAVLREEREWRAAMGDRRSAGRASQPWSPLEELAPAPVAVYGVPDRMPARREIVSTDSVFDQYADAPARPVAVPARPVVVPATTERVPAARGAQGEPWQPVSVPLPTYVTAPRAPRRLVDLTASAPAEALPSAERSLGIDDQGPELEHILGGRAVGG